MSKESIEETPKETPKETPARKAVVKEEPKSCDHKDEDNLEAVTADEAELPSIVGRLHNIFRCKNCGEVVVKDKK